MIPVIAFIAIQLAGIFLVSLMKVRWKGPVVLSVVLLNAMLSGYYAVLSLAGESFAVTLPGSWVTGPVTLQLDALSGWFLLTINAVFVTGGFYGMFYMKAYREQTNNLSLHGAVFILLHAALLSLCVVQNSIVFLVLWETMTLSAFLAVIFEHEKAATIRAGINYVIQSHVSIVFLMLGFIWVANKTGSYDFSAIRSYTATHDGVHSLALFLCFFIGFAIKAGFVPFHTWLPHAHPAAPSHISGIMSGVIIKIGIFGILRMLLLIQTDYSAVGFVILVFSVISGVYGVMLAIMQHNLKKLLAYHSIENIGIIGMGIGIGCIGLGSGSYLLAVLGFSGALLHTLNHALFKSLLFYTAGNVYQATHTLNVEQMGGLLKKMPQTAALFLVAAIAICGIPPFNGFVSEFLIYSGMYEGMQDAQLVSLVTIVFSVLGLATIGGLALLCFTKAFGVVFLGTPRHELRQPVHETSLGQLLPLYFIAGFIVLIGVFPQLFLSFLNRPVSLFTGALHAGISPLQGNVSGVMQSVSWAAWGFILLTAVLWWLRKRTVRNRKAAASPTWGCGYVAPTSKLQYTAGSFVRSYSKLFKPILTVKKEEEVGGVFPQEAHYESHPYDKAEKWLVDKPVKAFKRFMGCFLFLQNGKLQVYILYGILFIISIICIPMLYERLVAFIEFLKQL